MTTDGARRRRGLIEQERDGDIALAAQPLRVETLRLLPVGPSVDDVIYDGVEVVIVAVNLARDAHQAFRLHHLKLVANGRDYSAIALARLLDEGRSALLHTLFDDATPARPVIRQLSIPLVIVEGHLARFQALLGHFLLHPHLNAVQIVRVALPLCVGPRVEKLAR